ncbi:hypothetical protein Vretimale_9823 [Volvox reticuliferus]|uniref:Uncharacterized protein n=1 Tax=Volvox reticuliferus TaxID=1737510 RepID=A0A8J4CPF1_9CHLO|nr:hypothetical protein Vretifemale_13611 [Volvox reticuliferus]GIM05348.1 hypothetical protein Vretimale_9823 [Volvox reticuliferus]
MYVRMCACTYGLGPHQELDWVLGWTHRPNAAAHVLATAVTEGRLDTNREKLLMELVDTYIDCVGKCERIFKTPIPAAYTRHTSRYLMIYLTACPLVLWPSLGWWTLIAAVLITFLLLGTENIGVQIEEPFRVLPLDDMCRGIEATLREMERQHNRLGQQFDSWAVDPAGLSRASSESSLDSFIDGPADGPSEPAALDRFHHIPPPARLAAAAQALLLRRPSFQSGAGTPSAAAATAATTGSVDISGRFTTASSGELLAMQHQQHQHNLFSMPAHGFGAGGGAGSSRISGLLHHVMHPLGGGGGSASSGGAGAATGGAAGLFRNRSGSAPAAAAAAVGFSDSGELYPEYGGSGSGEGLTNHSPHASHYPHHVHHRHRNLPQHPADVPSTALTAAVATAVGPVAPPGPSVLSPSGSSRFARVSFERAPARRSDDEGRIGTAATPFARRSQQRQGELGQGHECREPPPAPAPPSLFQHPQPEQVKEEGARDDTLHIRTSGGGGENGKSGDHGGPGDGSGSALPAQGDVVSERERNPDAMVKR